MSQVRGAVADGQATARSSGDRPWREAAVASLGALARAFADEHEVRDRQRDGIMAFADLQDRRAGDCRSTVAACLDRVRGRPSAKTWAEPWRGMGHIDTAA